jgi:protein SCO1/2
MTLPLLVKKVLLLLLVLGIFLPGSAPGHQEVVSQDIGISEKTGDRIPPDLIFRDENGAFVNLRDIFTKPTILSLVYLTCDHICPQVLGGLAVALPGLKLSPGKDYQLVTISFDAQDDPATARQKKSNYIKAAGNSFPKNAWMFLTGGRESIAHLADAVGIRFQRDSHGFIHPVVLVFLSPRGVITGYHYVSRYQYGVEYPVTFSTAELNAGLADASRGAVTRGATKPVLYCFTHQPPGQERFFNLLAVIGVVTLMSVAALFIYLRITSRRSGP